MGLSTHSTIIMGVLDYISLVSPYYWIGAGIFLVVISMLLFCVGVWRRMEMLMEQDVEEQTQYSQHMEEYPSPPQVVPVQSEDKPPSGPPPYTHQHQQGLEEEAGFKPLPSLSYSLQEPSQPSQQVRECHGGPTLNQTWS